MAIRIKITSGFVSQSKLAASLEEGFKNATGGNTSSLNKEITQFRACFHEPISKGDTFDMVYLPTHGVIVNKKGKHKGIVTGSIFKRVEVGKLRGWALLGGWVNRLAGTLFTPFIFADQTRWRSY